MKRFRATFKAKDGSVQYLHVLAKDRTEAERKTKEAQQRREERFPLTFARLEAAKETGETGMLATPPRMGSVTDWVKSEVERRKRDQNRYDGEGLKLMKIEEVK